MSHFNVYYTIRLVPL